MANDIVPFSIELAQSFYASKDPHPVDLDDAWGWLGYAEKRNAWDTLKNYFEEGSDFSSSGTKSSTGGRSSKSIKLSVNCFKELGMIAKTEQGKKVRKYFLQCEDIAKKCVVLVPRLQARIAELESAQRILPPSLDKKLDAGMALANLSTALGDRRGMVTAQASLMNSLLPENTPDETVQFLSVTEVLESNGFKIPKGKDSSIGRKVAQAYREEVGEEPHTCSKHVGSGHKTANMKVYPQEFFERIVTIAQEYLDIS